MAWGELRTRWINTTWRTIETRRGTNLTNAGRSTVIVFCLCQNLDNHPLHEVDGCRRNDRTEEHLHSFDGLLRHIRARRSTVKLNDNMRRIIAVLANTHASRQNRDP